MAYRRIRDELGRAWDVWEVIPTAVERRVAQSQRMAAIAERRKVHETRVLVPDKLQSGWLAFQTATERRRLAPIPPEWDEMTDEELVELLGQASRRTRNRRLSE